MNDIQFPLNFQMSLVIGAVGVSLRLTALVLRAFAVYVSEIQPLPKKQAVEHRKTSCLYPFKGPSGEVRPETRPRSDAKGQKFSGCAAANLIQTD